MIKTLYILCILYFVCVAANAEKQYPFHFVAAYDQAQKARLEADNKLFANMKLLEEWLINFKKENGHLPELGSEQNNALADLATYLNPNPYSQTGIMTANERRICPLKFSVNLTLDKKTSEQWECAAPDSWLAEPGSLAVISNTQDFFLIWGAGADRQPLHDTQSKKYRLVFRNCKENP